VAKKARFNRTHEAWRALAVSRVCPSSVYNVTAVTIGAFLGKSVTEGSSCALIGILAYSAPTRLYVDYSTVSGLARRQVRTSASGIRRLGRIYAKYASSRFIMRICLAALVIVGLRAQSRTTAAAFTVVFHSALIGTLRMADTTDTFHSDGDITTVRPRTRRLYVFPTMEVFAF
jgi:hypothetical protein